MHFFTQEDITLLETQAGQPYDKTNTTHRQIGQSLRRGVVAKTKHLAKLVVEQVQTLGYEVVLRHHWHDVDRVTDIPIYKPYTWASFTKPDAATDHIYFTLGVDGGRNNEGGKVVVKLDYQRKDPPGRQASPNLTKEQRRTIQLFLDSEGGPSIGWHTVLPLNLVNHDWQTLVQWAADFIRANDALYDETVRMIQIGGTAPQWGGGHPPLDETVRRRTSYLLEGQIIDPSDTHYTMSVALWRQLRDLCGVENVAAESPTGYRTRIDLEVRNPTTNARLLFELKSGTGPASLRPAVREALGQLIEYAFWPSKPAHVSALIIATPNPASTALMRFLARISLPNSVPLNYLQVDPTAGADVVHLENMLRQYGII